MSQEWEQAIAHLEWIEKSGYYYRLRSPFSMSGEDYYLADATRHDCSGWNGRSDFRGICKTMPAAIANLVKAMKEGCDRPDIDRNVLHTD